MATQLFIRSPLLSRPQQALASLLARTISSLSGPAAASRPQPSLSVLLLHRVRPLSAASAEFRLGLTASSAARSFSTRATSSSLKDPNPNWSNRPPQETILLDGCDFEHWLVVMEKPEGDPTRDDIIDKYIKTLAKIVGSEEEARMKIYSVSTRCYFAFGALVSEEDSLKLKELEGVRWVLPDSYLDVKNKDYGGEPFINGQAVPYDPKYHEEWIRNNGRANERNRRSDRPRNHDRPRIFERRENMQNNSNFQNAGPPNQGGAPPLPNHGGPPNQGYQGGPPNQRYQGGPPNQGYQGGPPNQGFQGGPPNQGYQGGPPNQGFQSGPPNQGFQGGPPNLGFQGGNMAPNMGGMQPPRNMSGVPPQHNLGGGMQPQHNMGGPPPPPPNQGWNSSPPSNFQDQGFTPTRDPSY